jgi:hypothetical protein
MLVNYTPLGRLQFAQPGSGERWDSLTATSPTCPEWSGGWIWRSSPRECSRTAWAPASISTPRTATGAANPVAVDSPPERGLVNNCELPLVSRGRAGTDESTIVDADLTLVMGATW